MERRREKISLCGGNPSRKFTNLDYRAKKKKKEKKNAKCIKLGIGTNPIPILFENLRYFIFSDIL